MEPYWIAPIFVAIIVFGVIASMLVEGIFGKGKEKTAKRLEKLVNELKEENATIMSELIVLREYVSDMHRMMKEVE